jgi:cysteine desulfurase family protein
MIYLDNASTTFPKPPTVAAAMTRFMTEVGASPGRGGYGASVAAEAIVDDVRRRLTKLVGGDDSRRMVFTSSCTDALNLAIHGVLKQGDHVVATLLDHNSVSRPLQALADAKIITLTRVRFSRDGFIDPADIATACTARTRLVVLNHASNVLGTIQPVAEVGRIARDRGALFLLDAAQTIGAVDIDVAAMHVDLLAFPAHKELLGPPGLGGLYVAPGMEVRPTRLGGTGGDSAAPKQPDEWPYHLEAGTLNMVGIAGLQAALDVVRPAEALAYVRSLLAWFVAAVENVPGLHLYGSRDLSRCVGTLSLRLDSFAPEDLAAALDASFGICVRGGLQCAPYLHRELGTFPDGTVRVSPGPFTTDAEMDQLAIALRALAGAS